MFTRATKRSGDNDVQRDEREQARDDAAAGEETASPAQDRDGRAKPV